VSGLDVLGVRVLSARPSGIWTTIKPLAVLSKPFWTGATSHRAWLFTFGAFAFALGDVGMQYQLNRWNKSFYDALELRSAVLIQSAAAWFFILLVAATLTVMAATLCKILLQVAWREYLTKKAIAAWLDDQAFYRMTIIRGNDFAPEHRIAEDIRLTVEPIVDLTIGVVSAFVTGVTFASVLWYSGGSITIGGVTIPGFMVFAGLAYALIVTASMRLFGGRYAQSIRDRSESEARFRFELTRLRENAESVALLGGQTGEKTSLYRHLQTVSSAWTNYGATWTRMTWVTYSNGLMTPVIPLIMMTPIYLSGTITLGTVMQTATAFAMFQSSLGWFTLNFARLSEWYASASRASELLSFIELANDGTPGSSRIAVTQGIGENLVLTDVSLHLEDGTVLLTDAQLQIAPGEMVLVSGESGAGKSTLVRAIAGIWPWGSGQIELPVRSKIAFLPQRSYLPTGTLRAAITYPHPVSEITDAEVCRALGLVGLSQLVPSLDIDKPWDKYLSGGEQQRLAFARVLVHKPTLVILDEATSALDVANEARMMELFTHYLFATTVISVAHRPSLYAYHNRVVTLRRRHSGPGVDIENGSTTLQHRMRHALVSISRSAKS
jgi:vitamin B12/bleomycin/antimicrobial peptide transport system ATP-binding/permease protein